MVYLRPRSGWRTGAAMVLEEDAEVLMRPRYWAGPTFLEDGPGESPIGYASTGCSADCTATVSLPYSAS